MKRTQSFCIFLSFLLLWLVFSANADHSEAQYTLSQLRQQAQGGWHQVYKAHGRTIQVDIPIDVPNARHFPAFRAALQPPSAMIPAGEKSALFGYYDGENTLVNFSGLLQWHAGDTQAYHSQCKGSEPPFEGHILYPPNVDWDTPYSINNTATVRTLFHKAMGIWQKYFPGQTLDLRLIEVWAGTAHRKFDWSIEEFVGPALDTKANAYLAPKFEQLISDIPLLAYADDSFLRFGGMLDGFQSLPFGYTPPGVRIYSRSLQAMCGVDGLQENINFSTLQVINSLVEDLPLCSLDKVIASYETLISAGQLRHIQSLRLGYAIWEDRESPGTYLLLPAWVAWGVLVQKPEKEAWFNKKFSSLADSRFWESNEYGPILVNAQTGGLINPWNTSKARAQDAPGLIPWQ